VEDLADGLCAAARAPKAAGGAYFWPHRDPVSWRELGATAAQIMGRRPRTLRVPVAAANSIAFFGEMWSRSRGILLSSRERRSRKLVAGFGPVTLRALPRTSAFEAPTPLAAGLAKTLAWYKEAGWLKY
jgi:nucleoside-diphosphate-sugar epimerase